jgi:hypothetical protein
LVFVDTDDVDIVDPNDLENPEREMASPLAPGLLRGGDGRGSRLGDGLEDTGDSIQGACKGTSPGAITGAQPAGGIPVINCLGRGNQNRRSNECASQTPRATETLSLLCLCVNITSVTLRQFCCRGCSRGCSGLDRTFCPIPSVELPHAHALTLDAESAAFSTPSNLSSGVLATRCG